MTQQMTTNYLFDPAWLRELDRLRALEGLYDEASTRRLSDLGVREGWRCLEVGCGAGGVARWLAERAGSGGLVLATDLDPRFVQEGPGRHKLAVQRHDIVTDALEDGSFDLAHARAVLEHIPQREQALARMVAAVRPGGWVVVEDVDVEGGMAAAMLRYTQPPELTALYERVVRGIGALFSAIGADAGFGARLPEALQAAGLEQVGAEVHVTLVRGGADRDWVRLTVEHLHPRLVSTGLLSADDIDRFLELTAQPSAWYAPPFMVTAWGRRA
jgi:SAM-dependent methyltransferase